MSFFLTSSLTNVAAQTNEGSLRNALVATALKYRGTPYVYGAESPRAFDCSGFVRYVYREATGIVIPRTSRQQWAAGFPIALAKAKPGDVLVFDTVGGAPSHVGIFIDSESLIHAVSEGPMTGVIVSALSDRYFAPRLMGARLFVPSSPSARTVETVPAQTQETRPATSTRQSATVESLVSLVGFSITDSPVLYVDKIPAEVGTGIQFAVTNATGRDGVFEILFYKMDMDPSKAKTLRRDRLRIGAGGMVETEPVFFTEGGQYRLILKTHDNIKRVERTWKVVEIR